MTTSENPSAADNQQETHIRKEIEFFIEARDKTIRFIELVDKTRHTDNPFPSRMEAEFYASQVRVYEKIKRVEDEDRDLFNKVLDDIGLTAKDDIHVWPYVEKKVEGSSETTRHAPNE